MAGRGDTWASSARFALGSEQTILAKRRLWVFGVNIQPRDLRFGSNSSRSANGGSGEAPGKSALVARPSGRGIGSEYTAMERSMSQSGEILHVPLRRRRGELTGYAGGSSARSVFVMIALRLPARRVGAAGDRVRTSAVPPSCGRVTSGNCLTPVKCALRQDTDSEARRDGRPRSMAALGATAAVALTASLDKRN